MAALQFRGKEAILNAFNSRDVEAWSIFQGKQFIHKGIGAADLESFLSMIESASNTSVYTLKIYEDFTIADLGKIKEKTECDGSYNFSLQDMTVNGVYQPVTQYYGKMDQRIRMLEEKLLEAQQPEEPEETLGSILMDPAKVVQYVDILKGLFSNNNNPSTYTPQMPQRQIPATMGNATPQTTDEKLDRIAAALDILGRTDPKICEHLEKLADISVKNPKQFSSLLSMLEMF